MFFKNARLDPAAYFQKYVDSNPDLAYAMRNAKRVNEFKLEGDYSYKMDTFTGNGFALIGDAARFVDPIFSSGVSVALSARNTHLSESSLLLRQVTSVKRL
jgi:FADH2 O2-dependent halogenase